MVSSSPSSLGATKSHSSRAVGMPMRCTTCRERKSRAIEANQSSTAALSPNRTLVSVLKLRGHHDVEARQRRGERFAEVPANALFEQGCADDARCDCGVPLASAVHARDLPRGGSVSSTSRQAVTSVRLDTIHCRANSWRPRKPISTRAATRSATRKYPDRDIVAILAGNTVRVLAAATQPRNPRPSLRRCCAGYGAARCATCGSPLA